MRIQELLEHLEHVRHLRVSKEAGPHTTPQAYRVVNKAKLESALLHMKEVSPFSQRAGELLGYAAMVGPSVNDPQMGELIDDVQELNLDAEKLARALRQCLTLPPAETIAIRLPEGVSDFSGLRHSLDQLEKVFIAPFPRAFGASAGATINPD